MEEKFNAGNISVSEFISKLRALDLTYINSEEGIDFEIQNLEYEYADTLAGVFSEEFIKSRMRDLIDY